MLKFEQVIYFRLPGSSEMWFAAIISRSFYLALESDEACVCLHVIRKPAELLDVKSVLQDKIPVIKRFTGGGTVIVDQGTVFVSLICNKDAVPGVQPYPQPIMAWSSLFYDEVFHGAGDFKLRENGNRSQIWGYFFYSV